MCYHASFSFNQFQLAERYKIAAEEIPNGTTLPQPYVNAFAFPVLPVIVGHDHLKIALMQWGLIPYWTKGSEEAEKIRVMTLNAKAETLHEKPAFRHTLKSKRCIIPLSAFFEWREIQKQKYPYCLQGRENIFSVAGIYDEWTDKSSGEIVPTFALVTAPANALMEQIHNTKKRMPLILSREFENEWLQKDFDPGMLQKELQQLKEITLQAKPIAKDFQAKSRESEFEKFTAEIPYPELAFYPID